MKESIREALITGVMSAQHLGTDKLGSVTFYSCTHVSSIAEKYLNTGDYYQMMRDLDRLGERYTRVLQKRLDAGEHHKESMEPDTMPVQNAAFLHAFCRRSHPVGKWEEHMYAERVAWLNWLLVELKGDTNE